MISEDDCYKWSGKIQKVGVAGVGPVDGWMDLRKIYIFKLLRSIEVHLVYM